MKGKSLSKWLSVLLAVCITASGLLTMSVSAYDRVDEFPDFDPDLYAADVMVNRKGNDDAAYHLLVDRIAWDSPASKLATVISGDSDLQQEMAAWKLLTFKPSNGIDDVIEEKDYYEGIILSALKQFTDSSFVSDTFNNKYVKEAKAIFSNFKNNLKLSYGISYVSSLDTNTIKKIPANELNECFSKSFKEVFPGVNGVGECISYFSTFVDAAETIEKAIDNWIAYFQCVKMSDELKQIISDLYDMTDVTNAALHEALYTIKKASKSYISAFEVSRFDTTIRTASFMAKEGIDDLYTAILSESPYGVAFLVGQAAGTGLANFLFNADAIVGQNYNILCFAEFEALVNQLALKYIGNYLKTPNNDNADRLFAIVDMLYTNYDDGCQAAKKLYDLVYTQNKYTTLLNIIDPTVGENYLKAVTAIEGLQRSNQLDHQLVRYDYYYRSLEREYPEIYQKMVDCGEYIPPETIVERGYCGATWDRKNVEFVLCNNGNLIISGEGDMMPFFEVCGATDYEYIPFYLYPNIQRVVIKYGVTNIGVCAFADCGNLKEIIIPDSVTIVEDCAFFDCNSLKNITIPSSLTCIEGDEGGGFFDGCYNLVNIFVDPENVYFSSENGVLYNKDKTKLLRCPRGRMGNYTIPDGVTTIGEGAFGGCTSLNSITIPDSVTSIEDLAFYIEDLALCDGYSLASIIIPDSVKSIGKYAFEGCNNVTIYGKKGSYAETYAKENGIKFVAGNIPLSNLTSISADEITVGDTITVNCAASGGTAPYQYNVIYKKSSSDKWTTVQKYSSNATLTFKPAAAVSYDIKVKARDAEGKVMSKTFTVKVNKKLTNTSKLGAESIKKGEKVKVRCFAQGGVGEYQYAVYYKKATSSKWTILRGYGTSNIIMLKPAAAVAYDVRVDVKDKNGTVASKTMTLTVTK